jgi:hypothetical protein
LIVLKDNGHINEEWLKAVKKSVEAYNEPIAEDKLCSGWEHLESDMHRKFSGRQIIAWSSLAVAAAVLIALLVVPLHKIENQSNVNSIAQNTTVKNTIVQSTTAQSNTVQSTTTQSTIVQNASAQNASAQNNTALQTAATQETVKNISRGAVAVNRTSGGYSENSRYAVSYGFQVRVGIQSSGRFLKDSPEKRYNAAENSKAVEKKSADNTATEKKYAEKKSRRSRNTFELGEPIRVSSRGKWTAGLMMRNANGRKNNNNDSQLYYDSAPVDNSTMLILAQSFLVSTSPADYSHKQPISVGITVERKLGSRGRFSVESGIVYSLLNSDVTSGNYELRQHIHYLGIPVAVKWNFVNAGRFTVYAEGGGMVEKSIAGRMENRDNKKLNTGHFNVKGFQYSLAANAGAEYKIYKNVGIYVQPGVSYYFKPAKLGTFYINEGNSGSVGGASGYGRAFELENIHTNNRIGLSLQAGIRLSY